MDLPAGDRSVAAEKSRRRYRVISDTSKIRVRLHAAHINRTLEFHRLAFAKQKKRRPKAFVHGHNLARAERLQSSLRKLAIPGEKRRSGQSKAVRTSEVQSIPTLPILMVAQGASSVSVLFQKKNFALAPEGRHRRP